MTRPIASCLALLLLTSCDQGGTPQGRSFLAPLDGQSAVPLDLDLLFRTGGLDVPDSYDLPPDLITVVDLTQGGLVPGQVLRDGDDLRFRPDAPWSQDGRYLWTVHTLQPTPHGPEFKLRKKLLGTAVFDTSSRLTMLAATQDPDQQSVCLVFSRPLSADDAGRITLTANDVPLDNFVLQVLTDDDWSDRPYPLLPGDAGEGVMCVDTDEALSIGTGLRLWWGEVGPWHAVVQELPIAEVVAQLRRDAL